ncbi:flagellar protein [Bosea caraganae]|uniref:Flagellar protein FliL n=1 Tax=Bosea caraganae TaxID=2763117 RepID=A0A370LC35_9HYPH|nr:flagellar basal body-associated FliL family protein [Bosea caraganae]RDJ27445.1 flagellar protein [Bosea caraganae]RDJ29461.1 flagellar protein [Bosea caraganae]
MARARKLTGSKAGGGRPRGMWRAIGGFVLITALAVGAGVLSGSQLAGTVESNVMKRIEATPPALAADAAMAGTLTLKKLAPIVTNLASPANTWVRIEAALLMDRKSALNAEPMLGTIADDMLAYLRSVTARQLEGAAGLKNLREDLSERIAIRSKGLVRDVVIETLVVQ